MHFISKGGKAARLALALTLALPGVVHANCGSAFCVVNTDWDTQGAWDRPGTRVDLRFEYIDQDQLRDGTHKTGPTGEEHDEVRTLNRNWLLTVDHAFDEHWAVSVQAPWVDRRHQHIHNHDDGDSEAQSWDFSEFGDLRVVGRYQFGGMNPGGGSTGIRFGLKLPTGSTSQDNDEGEAAERNLQPGTGSTDLMLGAYYNAIVPGSPASWFAQASVQLPVDYDDEFRPGKQVSLDLGLRYPMNATVAAMIQANFFWRDKDTGGEAETDESGITQLNLSPGLAVAVGAGTQIYGFVQVPIYQDVRGVQLTADWGAVVGLAHLF